MAFTASQAFDLLRTAFSRNRLPHALLIVGDEHQGASRLILQLLELINGIRADHLDLSLIHILFCNGFGIRSQAKIVVY